MEQEPQRSEQAERRNEINAAIYEATMFSQPIGHLTAKRIAESIHPGSGALYDLAMTGEISEGIFAELDVGREVLPELANTWIGALDTYCQSRQHSGRVPGWWQPPKPAAEQARMSDDELIRYHITEALREQRAIDHATARCIASQLHGGQASPLYALASSGALAEGVQHELDGWRTSETPVEVEPWLDALDEYLDTRQESPGAVEGWSGLWPTAPEHADSNDVSAEEAAGADIPPLNPGDGGDGYDWIERLPTGWHAVASWGRDGWDLGNWPYTIVVAYGSPRTNTYAMGIYTEGDITVLRFPSKEFLYDALDDVAEWYWRNGDAQGPKDLPERQGLLEHHRRPFRWKRLDEG